MGRRPLVVGICTSTRSDTPDGDEPTGRNPLAWALRSLAAQDATVDAVTILKHGEPTPPFLAVVDRFSAVLPISVESRDRSESLGAMRNRLLDVAGDRLLYYLDDDAVLCSPSGLSRQLAAFAAAGDGVAVLQAPVLRRSVRPRPLASAAPVARVFPDLGDVTFAFDTALVQAEGAAAAPPPVFGVDHLCLAQALVDPGPLRRAGGFATFPWPAVYAHESELAARVGRAGGRLVFLADPEAAVAHMKYGAPHWTGTDFDDVTLAGGVSFATAARLSEAGHDTSWSRKSSAGFFADFVSGFGAVFSLWGDDAVTRFLGRTRHRFVDHNALHHPFVHPIPEPGDRAAAFADGLARLRDAGMVADGWAAEAGACQPGACGVKWI